MDWTALAAIGQVIAATGVMITLIYLSLQIRQNTEQTKLTSSAAIDTSLMLAFDPIFIPENSKIWTKGHATPELLDEHEAHVFEMLMTRAVAASFNTTSFHHSRGFYDPQLYANLSAYYRMIISTPGGSQWYKNFRPILITVAQRELDKAVEPQLAQGENAA